jgi:hypothetical protein
MGKLINSLRQLVKEEIAIHEDRLGKGLVIADPEKAAKLKRLYPEDYWVVKIITTIENATDRDITRLGYKDPRTGEFIDGLKQILNIKPERINPELRELIKSGVLVDKAETAIPKKEKPETTGKKGRKASDTSKEGVVRLLAQRWTADPEYVPSEEEITYVIPKSNGQTETFTADQVAKLKAKVLGLSKRGRKLSGEDPLLSRVNRALSEQPLHEVYKRLQHLK